MTADLAARPTRQLLRRAQQLRAQLRTLASRWACDLPDCDGMPHEGWAHRHARATQRAPKGSWRIWAIISGRGYGKTRTGAETCREWGTREPLHIAVVGETFTKVKDLCFEHPTSGLIAVIPAELVAKDGYRSSPGATKLTLKNGTVFRAMSAQRPDQPRGYAFDKAWYDEYGSWSPKTAEDINSNIWFALRESPSPQVLITTTPKPLPHIKKLLKRAREGTGVVLTTGHMRENIANLSEDAVAELESAYDGTRTGRQELGGELLEDVEGALWQLWMFAADGFRVEPDDVPALSRVEVAVDPAASDNEESDATGIVVAGRDYGRISSYADERPRGYVLHSEEVRGMPEERMRRAVELYHHHKADCVVIEANNGGDWIPAVLRQIDPSVPWRLVHATRGKATRAEPVSSLYQQYRISHVGPGLRHAKLEDQMTTWTESDDDSPDLMDALVWVLTSLLVNDVVVGTRKAADHRLRGRR